MMTAMLTVENILAGERVYDVWRVNQDAEYHEAQDADPHWRDPDGAGRCSAPPDPPPDEMVRPDVWLPSQNGGGHRGTKRREPEDAVAERRQVDAGLSRPECG